MSDFGRIRFDSPHAPTRAIDPSFDARAATTTSRAPRSTSPARRSRRWSFDVAMRASGRLRATLFGDGANYESRVRACEDALDARDDGDDDDTPDDVVDSATVCAEWTTVALARCGAAALESRGRARETGRGKTHARSGLARVLGERAPSVDDACADARLWRCFVRAREVCGTTRVAAASGGEASGGAPDAARDGSND